MKKTANLLVLLTTIILLSCNSSTKKSSEVASYTYEEEKIDMSDDLKAKIPEWVEVGKVCYGLIVQINEDDKPVRGKPIKAKVVQINENFVVMKALETVSLVEVQGCTQMGLTKGQTWDEKDGDLFLTLEEAIDDLKKMNLYYVSDKVTVD